MMVLCLLIIGTFGFEHLTVDPVAHRLGMGYAQVGDGYNVHYNPAGLAFTVGSFYSSSYCNYIGGTHFGYLGYEKDQLGMGIRYFNGGRLKKTDELGQEYGSFGVHFIDINIGKGFFINDVSLGLSLKGVYANIDTLYSLGGGFDVGALYVVPDLDIQLGLAIKNIGVGIKPFIENRENFPYEVNLGAIKRTRYMWFGLDIVRPALQNFGLRVGAAYLVTERFEIKSSYNTLLSSIRTGSSGLDFLAGITAGFALSTNSICINYNYSPYFDLGGVHRVSVSLGG